MAYLQIHNIFTGHGETWLICGLAVGIAVTLGAMAGAVTGTRGIQSPGAGLPAGADLSHAGQHRFPEPPGSGTRGTAYGAMFAIGSLGSLILAPVIGGYAKRTSVQHALRIPLIIAVFMMIAALVLAMIGRS